MMMKHSEITKLLCDVGMTGGCTKVARIACTRQRGAYAEVEKCWFKQQQSEDKLLFQRPVSLNSREYSRSDGAATALDVVFGDNYLPRRLDPLQTPLSRNIYPPSSLSHTQCLCHAFSLPLPHLSLYLFQARSLFLSGSISAPLALAVFYRDTSPPAVEDGACSSSAINEWPNPRRRIVHHSTMPDTKSHCH